MAKFLLLLAVLALLSFFLRQFVEALFITSVVIFAVFLFLGLVFTFQGLSGNDFQLFVFGLVMALFSASYILTSYIYLKRKKDKGEP